MKKALFLVLILGLMLPLAGQDLKAFSNQFADIAESVTPSVVTITAQKVTKIQNPFGDFNFPFEFFGFNMPQKEREFRSSALGSGVIVGEGYVITNNHVIENAEEIKIVLNDKREFKATVVGADSKTDIAVLQIDEKKLPAAKLGNSDKLRVGEWVLAIGSPFSTRLGNTVTHGIISGLGRSGMQLNTYESYIQTDASINPGNSGGALVNLDAEVIGINSAILSRSGGSNGIGFAIPINLAKKVMDDILTKGRVVRAWLGVTIQELNSELSESLGLKDVKGVLISDVMNGSPAESAKLQSGDVVIMVNDQTVSDPGELQLNIASRNPGETVSLEIIRDGKTRKINIKLGEMPEEAPMIATNNAGRVDLGFAVSENSKELAEKYKLSSENGVVISSVNAGSEAQQKGLKAGDRIVEIDRKGIGNMSDFNKALENVKKDQVILMLVEVAGGKRFVTLHAK
ncbi:MAG: DegQ family serine endoprotease [Candidatus Neomarinimicrobiota bacterium]|jgi:serine protease Do|nr:DegQ family serine endoprotease [Candidatus Neomarinimicrobiota bacterium]MDD3965749.1 DegQ family serine endoprotease [Candidatus Neomarinimicrobiota bacterium]MDX9780189.1 DegQ family serine endoprotease [bacterium]